MSAYVVENTHIDALLTAGFEFGGGIGGPLHWFDEVPPALEDYYASLASA